jgi:hypothetical protein
MKLRAEEKLLDYERIELARLKAGIKGYVTKLDCEAEIVIKGYHNLFNVEKSFRFSIAIFYMR